MRLAGLAAPTVALIAGCGQPPQAYLGSEYEDLVRTDRPPEIVAAIDDFSTPWSTGASPEAGQVFACEEFTYHRHLTETGAFQVICGSGIVHEVKNGRVTSSYISAAPAN